MLIKKALAVKELRPARPEDRDKAHVAEIKIAVERAREDVKEKNPEKTGGRDKRPGFIKKELKHFNKIPKRNFIQLILFLRGS